VNGDGPIAGPRLATSGEDDGGAFPGPLVPEAPPDTFWALGLQDQVMAVVPAHGIVAVRLGPAPPPDHPFGVQELTTGVLAAVADGGPGRRPPRRLAAGGQPAGAAGSVAPPRPRAARAAASVAGDGGAVSPATSTSSRFSRNSSTSAGS